MRELSQRVIDTHARTAESLLEVLADLSEPNARRLLVDEYQASGSCWDRSEPKKNRLHFGYFAAWDIIHILLKHKANTGGEYRVNQLVVIHVLERLKKFGLVTEADIPESGEIRIPEGSMRYFHDMRLDLNIVFGIPYMINNLSQAVPAISVKTSSGDVECGSGIILKLSPEERRSILLTNKHVIETNEIIEVKTEGETINLVSPPIFHEKVDLAAMWVEAGTAVPVVPIDDNPPVLTPVIALGYPTIPTAAQQFLMAHRGEINGRVKTLFGQTFLAISCVVGPGNSGGPILTEAGFCAGIVTQSGIGEFGSDDEPTGVHRVVYHMAIPPEVVGDFVQSVRAAAAQ